MNDRQKDLVQKFAALAGLLVLIAVFSLTSASFFGIGNAMTVALQVTSIAYLGIGATCVIITGGIDLSVGSILALSGVAAALEQDDVFARQRRTKHLLPATLQFVEELRRACPHD